MCDGPQVQELHHGLVAFCSELKSMDTEVDVTELSPVELRQRLESAQSQLQEKRQSLQNLKENISNAAAQRNTEWYRIEPLLPYYTIRISSCVTLI